MEYGKLISRSVDIVWQNKFLIIIGILASLGSGGSSGNFSGGGGGGSGGSGQPAGQPGQLPEFGDEFAGMAIGIILAIVCVALLFGIALWAVSTIARGGLISSVDTIEGGAKSSFSHSWRAGWQRVWPLLGIGFLPAIPGLILFAAGLLALGAYGGLFALFGEEIAVPTGIAGLGLPILLVTCIVVPIALVLSILRTFAERACMLENLGVIDSYKRGWQVLMANLGEAIILFLLQIGIGIIMGLLLFLPGLVLVLCCFLWPLLLALQGAIAAFTSTLWTLAWRTWTGGAAPVEKVPLAI